MSENAVSAEELHADRSRMEVSATEVAVDIVGMHKWYGSFHVLRDINLRVDGGITSHAPTYADIRRAVAAGR